ncbi:hypothetical protein ACHAXR_008001 [Thalassiosira sp. AJA248-18]
MICSSWPPTEKVQQRKKRSYVSRTVTKPEGSNVAIAKSRVLNRMSKNDSVLHKHDHSCFQHVKWLKELQEERRRLEEKKEAEQKEQLERKRLFMEREAKKRAAGKVGNDNESPSTLLDQDADDCTVASSVASMITYNKKRKPAWCQSETAHETSEEMAELDDEVNLMDFVNGLDFDQYTEDLELQTLMGQVKERIKKLEQENKKDETKLQTCLDSETAIKRAEALENGPVVDFVPADIENDEDDTDDTKSIANSVMSESSIGSIHSKKSLTALVSKARERQISDMAPIEEEGEKAMPPPVLSTVTDDNGARMAEKKSINKLAFKNRNPAL